MGPPGRALATQVFGCGKPRAGSVVAQLISDLGNLIALRREICISLVYVAGEPAARDRRPILGSIEVPGIAPTVGRSFGTVLALPDGSHADFITFHMPVARQAALAIGRFGAPEPLVAVPLSGVVTISQSFDGPFSHRGAWRHGLDFELPADIAPRGSILGAPIYCPTAGVVELIGDGVADNPLGVSNYSQNWGNYIIIRIDHGGWLMMAHLAQGSIGVVPGQRVAIGQPLATVGNSGRSPIPHLHLHVQSVPLPGAPMLPFKLANYVQGPTSGMIAPVWIRAGVPETSSFIRAALNVPASFGIAAGLAPGAGLWRITATGTIPARFSGFPHTEYLSTTLDPAGNHCVADSQVGQLVMHADADALRVYSVGGRPGLVLLLWSMALPVLPYCAVPGLSWSDRINLPPITLLDRIESSAAPYLSRPLAVVRLICTAIADETRKDMVVEARMLGHRKNFPVRVTVRLARVKGPITWEAHFEKGSILAELVSFGPLSADETAALN